MKISIFIVFFLLLSVFSFSLDIEKTKDYHDNIIILKLKPEYLEKFSDSKLQNYLFTKDILPEINKKFPNTVPPKNKYNKFGEPKVDLSLIYQIDYKTSIDIIPVIVYLEKTGYFEYVEPLYKVDLLYVPDDEYNESHQYWLDLIQAYDAWNIHKGDTNVVIGIVDTGIDIIHEDLIYNIKYNYNDLPNGNDDDFDGYVDNFRGWDFGDNNNNPQAEFSFHGSMVAGIAAADTDNGLGISGVGFKSKFLPIKVMNSEGVINSAYEGLVYAAEQGCQIINCSWGSHRYQQMAQDVINFATYNRNSLVVAAAGNDNNEVLFYPASYENVISVAATTSGDEKWTPANTGTSGGSTYNWLVDISAPGTIMRTTNNQNYSTAFAGTSYAAPVVSGVAAILRSYFPHKSALQIGSLIKNGADVIDTIPANIEYSGKLGTGRVNMYNSLTAEHQPDIVFKNISFDNTSFNNEVVTIYGEFINYLAPSENLSVSISSTSNNIQIVNDNIFIGSLSTFESYNPGSDIQVQLISQTPNDYSTFIKLEYNDGDFYAEQYIPITINNSFINIENNNLKLSVVPNGRFGFSDVNSNHGNGFVINNTHRLIYDSGIISGTGADRIYGAVRQITDFETFEYPYKVEGNELYSEKIITVFDDSRDSNPKDLEFKQTVYICDNPENQNFIIVNVDIINNNSTAVNDYYFGIFNDWDLVNPHDNSAAYCADSEILYCKHNGAETMYAGLKLLTSQNHNHYAFPQKPGGDGVIDITDGFSDIEKFHLISNTNYYYGSIDEENDIIIVNSAGPFDIPANDTVSVAFAFVAAESFYTFQNAASASQQFYDNITSPSFVVNNKNREIEIYPNPADNSVFVNLHNEINQADVHLYNSLGKLVLKRNNISNNLKLDLSELNSGIYYIKIISDNYEEVRKLVIKR